MQVQIDRLHYGDGDFGEWEFKADFSPNKIELKELKGLIKNAQVVGDERGFAYMAWDLAPLSSDKITTERCYFKGRFIGDDMAQVLSAWGYTQNVSSKDFSFDLDVSWPGSPSDYAFMHTEGKANIRMNKGSFVDLQGSSTSALKVVSAFSLSNLLRRIQLDFTDLTDKGLSYDKLRANLVLDNGVVDFSQKPITIKGASSDIRFLGKANMLEENMDAELSVTLPLASNLPWVAALAAGLPTAIGVYIVSKLMETQVDKLSSAVYSVKGGFAEPEVQFLRLFDTSE